MRIDRTSTKKRGTVLGRLLAPGLPQTVRVPQRGRRLRPLRGPAQKLRTLPGVPAPPDPVRQLVSYFIILCTLLRAVF
jgi:hypothetical protein